jgi:formylglycine-generating enzyme required for sulfatase activity
MNSFDKTLDQAKRRQKRVYLIAGVTLVSALLLMTLLFVVLRGTRIEISPRDARENAVYRVDRGLGVCLGDTAYSFAGDLVISVVSPGFKAVSVAIDAQDLGKVFPLELSELPGHLVVEISGDDTLGAGTSWRIDNRVIGPSDALDIELDAGSYTLVIDNPFYQLKQVEVEISRGEETALQETLPEVNGVLNITSTPLGAAVFLDNEKVGQTPLKLTRTGGNHGLGLVLENYAQILEQLSITRVSPLVTRNYQLALKKGRVRLSLVPRGGTLLVNGVQRSAPLVLDATLEHRLTYMKQGFYPETRTIRLAASQEKQIFFELKPEMGRVEIISHPAATVLIDNKEVGTSPVSTDLTAVAHEITLKKDGYRSVAKRVVPKGGRVQKVSVTLFTEYQARLREAPRQLTNRAGIKLKLFVVSDSLTMGAPRSQKGQRANEFEKKIRLTKPFYASVYEITNSQFAAFDPKKKASGPGNMPVTSVSWQEAAAFCNWLSAKEKISPFYTSAKGKVTGFDPRSEGYRLLSEGEWEWLARKSGRTEQTLFTWGDARVIPPKTANVADESAKGQVRFFVPNYKDGYSGAAPVGSFDKEPSGLYDMAGNVSEWVHDVYSILPPRGEKIARNPLGEQRGVSHVVKGANWRSGTITTLRPAFREGLTAGRDDLGFRIGRYLYGGKNE